MPSEVGGREVSNQKVATCHYGMDTADWGVDFCFQDMTCQNSLGKYYPVRQWSPKWGVRITGSAQDSPLGCRKKVCFLNSVYIHLFLILF